MHSRHGDSCYACLRSCRDEAALLVPLLDGVVTAALCQFIFSRKQEHLPAGTWSCGCRDCGGVRHVAFDVPVGTGTFVHR